VLEARIREQALEWLRPPQERDRDRERGEPEESLRLLGLVGLVEHVEATEQLRAARLRR